MARLVWGPTDPSPDQGVSHGVLYLATGTYAWDGLLSVEERTSESTEKELYFEGSRYAVASKMSDFEATIEAFTYPPALDDQPSWLPFNLSYRTGRQIHLVYNAIAIPKSRDWRTMSAEADISAFSWDIVAKPVSVAQSRPTAHFFLDAGQAGAEADAYLKDLLYGTSSTDPDFPTVEELTELVLTHTTLRIYDHGDGTWTAIGPDSMIQMLEPTKFQIVSPSANWYGNYSTYTLRDYKP